MKTEAEVWAAAAAMAARASETYDGIARLCEQEGDAQGLQAAVARRDVTDALASGFTIRAAESKREELSVVVVGSAVASAPTGAPTGGTPLATVLPAELVALRAIAEAAQSYVRWLDDESTHTGDGETGDRLEETLRAVLKAGGR